MPSVHTNDEGSAALAQWVKTHAKGAEAVASVYPLDVGQTSMSVIAVPNGYELKSLKPFFDELRNNPSRRTGTAAMLDLASFIAHVNRFKNPNTDLVR
jgi:hypothetical protein